VAALLAALTAWRVAAVLTPAAQSGFGLLAVLGLVALALLARGYVV
jgi:hypothetical protein